MLKIHYNIAVKTTTSGLNQNTDKPVVIFSAVGDPSDFVVYKSLQIWRSECLIYVITSKKYAPLWQNHVDKILLTKSNSKGFLVTSTQKIIRRSNSIAKILRIILNTAKMSHISFTLMPPHNARHFYYKKALVGENPNSLVFLVDSRDLIFQESPKAIASKFGSINSVQLFDEGISSFKDGRNQLNGISLANLNWALELLNHKTERISQLLDKVIINSGCIIGTTSELIKFLKISEKTMLGSNYANISLLDQASVNFVAYCSGFPVNIFKNGDVVLNMCGIIESRVLEKNGKLFNGMNLIPIVHQFDRFGIWEIGTGFKFGKRQYEIQNSF
jgi:hypothetical protein